MTFPLHFAAQFELKQIILTYMFKCCLDTVMWFVCDCHVILVCVYAVTCIDKVPMLRQYTVDSEQIQIAG